MRTAGSVFRNPPEKSSGRILELAGCKNLNIGGAFVTDIHANIVAAGKGATASDLLALMTEMRRRALQMGNVALEPEVKLLGLTATGISLICAE
jgi:UDP-N-acetylmuramate dehydrogenase